ncbi:MAG: hypothetical protein JRF27_01800 [Deltaproteobacteria bacterium]|jgi:hypothetical protein|nr:hypothetical protein [Deltaproteobacteria bacterium]MBW2192499.1 hypothetical protein [Deltaproteobacteria bacterium]
MKEKLIKTMDLENNMRLNFYDDSRKLAGDRWLVSLMVRMEIPVSETLLPGDRQSVEEGEGPLGVLGEKVVFEQNRKRIFVDEDEKENVLRELIDRFQENTCHYLARESFPKQYVLKVYREEKKKRSWHRPQEE